MQGNLHRTPSVVEPERTGAPGRKRLGRTDVMLGQAFSKDRQTAAKAFSMMSRPSVSRCSGITSGGRKRSTLP